MATFKNRILGANPDSTERSLESDILLGCLLDAVDNCRAMFPEQIFKRASRNKSDGFIGIRLVNQKTGYLPASVRVMANQIVYFAPSPPVRSLSISR